MIRQYIGARYVIKIYENSQTPGSADWEANTEYEPITLVTYQNSSYLSKKEVPATVGNPVDNPSYWVYTGYYNGQIASLQDQINDIINTTIPGVESTLQGQISAVNNSIQWEFNTVNKKKMILLTDSFGGPNYYFQGKNMLELARDYMAIPAANCNCLWHDSYGFTSNPGFLDLLQTATLDPSTVTDIVVIGGNNDLGVNSNTIRAAIDAFTAYCHTTYPNAKITIMFDAFRPTAHGDNLVTPEQTYRVGAIANHANYANISKSINWSLMLQPDFVHPTSSGTYRLGKAIARYMITGSDKADPQDVWTASILFPAGSNATITGHIYQSILEESIMTIFAQGTEITLTTGITLQNNTPALIGQLENFVMMSQTYLPYLMPITIVVNGTAIPASLGFWDRNMYIVNNSGTNLLNVTSIKFPYCQLLAPIIYN